MCGDIPYKEKIVKLSQQFISWFFNEFSSHPLYVAMGDMVENSPWHREQSVSIHTNMVVAEYIALSHNEWSQATVLGAFACAFHDVGKPGAVQHKFSEERGDYKSFPGHETVSARLWEDYAVQNWELLVNKFNLTSSDIFRIGWLIEHHLPWSIKKEHKIAAITNTIDHAKIGRKVFSRVLLSDTLGRISDNADDKLLKVNEWFADVLATDLDWSMTEVKLPEHVVGQTKARNDNQPCLIMPIGPSGCGKSTLQYDYEYSNHYSWDALRLEYYSDDYAEAFKLSCDDPKFKSRVQSEFTSQLATGNTVYVDNTNLSTKRRRGMIDEARRKGYYIVAIVLPISLDQLYSRRTSRLDKTLPIEAVNRQYMSLQLPQLGEFDQIISNPTNLSEKL